MNATVLDQVQSSYATGTNIAAMTYSIQRQWEATPVKTRLRMLRRVRHLLAERTAELADAIPSTLARSRADTLASEVLPLLAACKFLEREASSILQTRHLSRRGLPFWLSGVKSAVQRVPFGTILVIGPSNYPLFLPGVQVLQALAAGNAVIWKPGTGGGAVATVVAQAFADAGLPPHLLRVTGESAQEGLKQLETGVGKVFFTGSGAAGRSVLHAAADRAIPVTVELSGCDAVVVLPSADPLRVTAALAFGMRLNGSATCMAPRRLMLIGPGHEPLVSSIKTSFQNMDGVLVREPVRTQLRQLLEDAETQGATVCGDRRAVWMKPLLVMDGRPTMRVAQSDVFAPVLTVMHFKNVDEMLRGEALCPYGLTASIFGDEKAARQLAQCLEVGTVLINDLIVPTVDPRVPFGGRRQAGFGTTRGAEGLLEMTAAKTTLTRRGQATRHYDSTGDHHETMFTGLAELTHGRGLRSRINGLQMMLAGAKKLQRGKV